MKRTTKVLIIGREAHVVSCDSSVDCSSADAIVSAMAFGTVKVLGTGIVEGGKITKTIDMKGDPMHFPNRTEKLTLLDVSKRQSFAKLSDVMPAPLKAMSSNSGWHEEKIAISCFNCHSQIPGKRRVKGAMTQIFRPDSKDVTHIGKRWYCGCTSKPAIPKHSDIIAKKVIEALDRRSAMWPHMTATSPVPTAVMVISFTGTPTEIADAVKAYALLLK